MYAILNENKEVVELPQAEWLVRFQDKNRTVGRTIISRRKKILVSTVFLGIDHGHTEKLWFETMIFGTSLDGWQRRYPDWKSAEKGHALAVHYARRARWTTRPR